MDDQANNPAKAKEKTWQETQQEQDTQRLCSHDAPGQQAGAACVRCGKILPKADGKK